MVMKPNAGHRVSDTFLHVPVKTMLLILRRKLVGLLLKLGVSPLTAVNCQRIANNPSDVPLSYVLWLSLQKQKCPLSLTDFAPPHSFCSTLATLQPREDSQFDCFKQRIILTPSKCPPTRIDF